MSSLPLLPRTVLVLGITALLAGTVSAATPKRDGDGGLPRVERSVPMATVQVAGTAVVNLADLARQEARVPKFARPPVRPLVQNERDGEEDMEQPDERGLAPLAGFLTGRSLDIASPAPSLSFAGLDDIAMVDSSYIIIPPDVNGAVGRTKIFQNLNNNVRVLDKATGAVLSTVGVNTWWAPTGGSPNNYSDPRSVYDPYNDRFITISLGDLDQGTANTICLGVSDTSDPEGTWHLYRFVVYESSTYRYADFPTVGFNKNWITICCNFFNSTQLAVRRSAFAIHYPSLRDSYTFTAYRGDYGTSGVICGAPCVTYSATCDTQYIVQRRGTSSYSLDMITGTGPDAPTYTIGSALTRPGGSWAAMGSSNYLPQSAPVSGSSSCSPPCRIERTDDNVRTSPVYRDGSIWFTQAVGLPQGGVTHVAAQWTQLTTPSGAFVVGGRLQDTLATVTNGLPHYAFPSISVNQNGDFLLGFTRFGSSQHPGAGYAMHVAADGAGTLRDTVIFKDGDDYYHKDFGSGRNRWGDFSTSQVDPSDDLTLWTVQEYAKARTSTDDGTTGTNGSKWGTWWAAVSPGPSSFTITASAGAGGAISPSGDVVVSQGADQAFTITPDTCHTIADVLVNGVPQGPVTTYTFTDVQADQTISASFAIRTFTIAASAGPGGTITPSGDVPVACAAEQAFSIAPDGAHHVLDVRVDDVSVGAQTEYTFHDVTAAHTIAASFSADSFLVNATATGRGGVTKTPDQPAYVHGSTVQLAPVPDAGWAFTGWSGDTTTTGVPLDLFVIRNWSVVAAFTDTTPPAVQVTYPVGGEHLVAGDAVDLAWSATDNVVVERVDLLLSRTGAGGPYDTLAAAVPNSGTYAWTANGPTTTDAFFRVSVRDSAGNAGAARSDSAFAITDLAAVDGGPVRDFALAAVSPNPARGPCRVSFALPRQATVRVSLLDVQGREVAVLASGERAAGRYEVTWSAAAGRVRPGLYFVRMTTPERTFQRRLVILR
jgi:hypothetical protein